MATEFAAFSAIIALTLKLADRIEAMRDADRQARPWAYLKAARS